MNRIKKNVKSFENISHTKLKLRLECGHVVYRPRKRRNIGLLDNNKLTVRSEEDKPPKWVYCEKCLKKHMSPYELFF